MLTGNTHLISDDFLAIGEIHSKFTRILPQMMQTHYTTLEYTHLTLLQPQQFWKVMRKVGYEKISAIFLVVKRIWSIWGAERGAAQI